MPRSKGGLRKQGLDEPAAEGVQHGAPGRRGTGGVGERRLDFCTPSTRAAVIHPRGEVQVRIKTLALCVYARFVIGFIKVLCGSLRFTVVH